MPIGANRLGTVDTCTEDCQSRVSVISCVGARPTVDGTVLQKSNARGDLHNKKKARKGLAGDDSSRSSLHGEDDGFAAIGGASFYIDQLENKEWYIYIMDFIRNIYLLGYGSFDPIAYDWFIDNYDLEKAMLVCVHICVAFSLVTWNTRGVLGNLVFQDPVQARAKRDAFSFVFKSSTVSFFQETHHGDADYEHLQAQIGSDFIVFQSKGVTRNEGGLLVTVKNKWYKGAIGSWCVEVFPGRSIIVFIAFLDCLWAFANLHIPPQWSFDEKCKLIRDTMGCIPEQPLCFCMFGGDLNFGEQCGALSPDTFISGNRGRDRVQAFFEDTYPIMTELIQEEATHWTPTSVSRTDRLYCNFYTSALMDSKPCMSILWRATGGFAKTSDHFPFRVSMLDGECPLAPSMPKWIPRNEKFMDLVAEKWAEIPHVDQNPGDEVLRATDVFVTCAEIIRKQVEVGQAVDLPQQIYWTLVCFRHVANPISEFCRRARIAYPKLNEFLGSDGREFDTSRLHQHLADLNTEYANNILEGDTDREISIQKKRALNLWIAKWAKSRRKFRTLTILDLQGNPTSSFEEGAELLGKHCEKTFALVEVDLEMARRQLGEFIVPLSFEEPTEEEELEYYHNKLNKVVDSGVGPDNVCYSFWSLAPPPICDVPFENYKYLKNGGQPYEGMNYSKLVVIPKEDPDDPADETQNIRVDHVRPLSLSNVDSKLVASVAIHPVTVAASKQLHENQRGGLSGRQLVDDILDIEAKAIQFAMQNAILAALFCFRYQDCLPCPGQSLHFLDFAYDGHQ